MNALVLTIGAATLAASAPAVAQIPQYYSCGTAGTPACPSKQDRTEAAKPAPNSVRYGERTEQQTNENNPSAVNSSDRSSGKDTGSRVSPQ